VLKETLSIANVYELFTQHVSVELQTQAKRETCAQGPRAVCPGIGPMLRVQTAVMQGDKRRCVM
jgi:hypothetical protein